MFQRLKLMAAEKFLLNETLPDFIDLRLMLFDHRKNHLINGYDIIMTELKKDPGNTYARTINKYVKLRDSANLP